MSDAAHITSLCRYPVKGLNPQRLEHLLLSPGKTVPWDRAYAIENGPSSFDPQNPAHLQKISFLMLMRNERLAELETHFDETDHTLEIRHKGEEMVKGRLDTSDGRERIEAFFAQFMEDALAGPPRILSAAGHSFSDVDVKCLHLVNLASVRALEPEAGCPLDPVRFRANIYFDGADPWAEKTWVGKQIRVGDARLEVFSETQRCAATDVDPKTATRKTELGKTLLKSFGHMNFGIYARVIEGGTVRNGDMLNIIELD